MSCICKNYSNICSFLIVACILKPKSTMAKGNLDGLLYEQEVNVLSFENYFQLLTQAITNRINQTVSNTLFS